MLVKYVCSFCFSIVLSALSASALAQNAVHDSHIAIDNPAELTKAKAQKIYEELKDRMAANYAVSQLKEIQDYQSWTQFNDAPYASATHGQRYVNNFANDTAKDYATLGEGERLPEGAILLKDSITATDEGKIFPGALFGMEKLAANASPETADWRYFMVIPDGSVYGDTTGDNPELMIYCHECHAMVADRDYTFYVPEGYRSMR